MAGAEAAFLEQARTLSGAALAAHIDRALQRPALFAFAELLDLPSVATVRGRGRGRGARRAVRPRGLPTPHAYTPRAHLSRRPAPPRHPATPPQLAASCVPEHVNKVDLLNLFAYGTYANYRGEPLHASRRTPRRRRRTPAHTCPPFHPLLQPSPPASVHWRPRRCTS
jgi:hypothetical protein